MWSNMKYFLNIAALLLISSFAYTSYVQVGLLPPGIVVEAPGGTCPIHSVPEDGTSYLRAGTYANLFASLGTIYGTVDGNHFNVRDHRGKVSRGDTSTMGNVLITAIASNAATVTAHGFNLSGVPVQITGTTPTGLSNSTTYWEIYVDANHIKFASSQANALAGTAISISGSTGGNVVSWVDPDYTTLRYQGAIGSASSGLGSYEDDMFASHTHTYGDSANYGAGSAGAYDARNYGSYTTSATGGNETRGKNIASLFCVYY
jgi:microcystin-dependent protein